MTREETIRIIELIVAQKPDWGVTPDLIDLWQACFAKVSFEQARQGLVAHFSESPHLPAPNDILRHILQMQKGIAGAKTREQDAEWKAEQARKFWQEYGNFTPPIPTKKALPKLKAMPNTQTLTDEQQEARRRLLDEQRRQILTGLYGDSAA